MTFKLYSASCHCKRIALSVPLVPNKVQDISLCHCDACRRTTGNSAVGAIALPRFPLQVATQQDDVQASRFDLSLLDKYTAGGIDRYFCPKCAAAVLFHTAPDTNEECGLAAQAKAGDIDGSGTWLLSLGLLAEKSDRSELYSITSHVYVADTLDGGLAKHLSSFAENTLPLYTKGPRSPLFLPEYPQIKTVKQGDRLDFHCHCGSVKFSIDTLIAPTEDPSEWWARPAGDSSVCPPLPTVLADGETHIKHLAGYCVCNDCRASSGHLITSWSFVSREKLRVCDQALEEPLSEESVKNAANTLSIYASSSLGRRAFCSTCGARAFDWSADRVRGDGMECVGICLGLVDTCQSGGLVGSPWFDWFPVVYQASSATDQRVVDPLLAGLTGQMSQTVEEEKA